jgi:hypothetical protein
MNNEIERQIKSLTPSYTSGIVIHLITAGLIIVAFVTNLLVLIPGGIFLIFSVLILNSTKNTISDMEKLLGSYEFEKEVTFDILDKYTDKIHKRIEVNERKAASGRRNDRNDSARDADRARRELAKWDALRQTIMNLHNKKNEDPYAA